MSKRWATFQVVWLGIGFFLILVAFNVTESMITTLCPSQGFNSLATIYTSFMLGSMGASYLTPRVDVRILFVLSGAAYAIFIAALTWVVFATCMLAAIYGLSGGILWIHQGALVTVQAAESNMPTGQLTAIFLVFYETTTIVGNLISFALLRSGMSRSTVLSILAIIAGVGTSWLALLRPPNHGIVAVPDAGSDQSLTNKMRTMVRVARARPMAAALLLILWNSALLTLAFANKPLPLMLVAFGIASAVTAPAVGTAYDAWGLAPLVWTLAHGAAYAAILDVPHITSNYGAALAVLVAAETFMGVMVAGTNCLINVILSAWFVLLALVSNAGAWQAVMALNHGLMLAAVGCLVHLIRTTRFGRRPRDLAVEVGADETAPRKVVDGEDGAERDRLVTESV
ncbi:hypothetical protein AMAG_13179 [Allomyces macrogynus ATCC 38327]|uniref:UNC93-like protein MFSD11 n=1 Tax=Allomyces macrogynus (strain ATCC 38327) TaxID=578462 RepID=A0A0L0T0A1_ALLM3|nr:hypothetical protein AMAG_13179 [Allomyces macrogynus ATCC 38327]|eukprot:KNE68004.1 hypothetical protein AMAG_13179 [Allomyces macrogynus ATCC 38327]